MHRFVEFLVERAYKKGPDEPTLPMNLPQVPNPKAKASNTLNKKVGEMNAQEKERYAARQEKGRKWIASHPISANNVLHTFDTATKEERRKGMGWYKHASQFSGIVAHDTHLPKRTVAGLVGNYSPQSDWFTNMINAARVAREKKGIGGKDQESFQGRKIMASTSQKKNADAMLAGKHYYDILRGYKVRDFTSLVHHGKDTNPTRPKLAVDRHAYSVEAGGRIPDEAFGQIGLQSLKNYRKYSEPYLQATSEINKRGKRKVNPFQVQAVTWLARQRKNTELDRRTALHNMVKKGGSWLPGLQPTAKDLPKEMTWGKNRSGTKERWNEYMKKYHPKALGLFDEYQFSSFADFIIEKFVQLRPSKHGEHAVGAGGRRKEHEFVKSLQTDKIVDRSFHPAGSSNKADVMTSRHYNMEYKADKGANAGQLELQYNKNRWDLSPRTVREQPATSKWLRGTGFIRQINRQWGKPSTSLRKNYAMGNVYKEIPGTKGIEAHYGQDRNTPYMHIGGKGTYRVGKSDPDLWGVPQLSGNTQIRARFKNRGHKAKAGALVNISFKGNMKPSNLDLENKKSRKQFSMRRFGVDYPYES